MTEVVATIVARNTLALARVLAESLRAVHPGVPCHVLLADEPDGSFDPAGEPFLVTPFAALGLERPERWCFRYGQPDLCYALTPGFLEHLLDRGCGRVLFLKQESLVVGDLGPLLARLDEAPILLTPHLLTPLAGADGAARELDVLLAGAFNGGVLGVAEAPSSRRFLAWWRARVERHCRYAVVDGMHFEQRWLDLVPALFPPVVIEREPGANLGHWSYPERRVESVRGELTVDGRPLRVARFSGYDSDRPAAVTRHGDRLQVDELGPAAALFARYRQALERADHRQCRRASVAWARFADGVTIPPLARAIYRELDDGEAGRFADPFATGRGSFRAWLFEDEAGLPRFWRRVWRERADLRRAFPALDGRDRRAFRRWTVEQGPEELGCAELVRAARGERAAAGWAPARLARRWRTVDRS